MSDDTGQFERRMREYDQRNRPNRWQSAPSWMTEILKAALMLGVGGGVAGSVATTQNETTRVQSDQGVTILAQQLDYWHDRAEECEAQQP